MSYTTKIILMCVWNHHRITLLCPNYPRQPTSYSDLWKSPNFDWLNLLFFCFNTNLGQDTSDVWRHCWKAVGISIVITNHEIVCTKFGKREHLSEFNKHIKFGWDRFTGDHSTRRWNVTVLGILLSFFVPLSMSHLWSDKLPFTELLIWCFQSKVID